MEKSLSIYLRSAFQDKKVLVTGDTGFKGSWLCHILLLLGAEVCGVSLPAESSESHFELTRLSKRIKHIDCDICDSAQVEEILKSEQPQFVFHLAAQSLVLDSYQDPKRTFDTNVGGSVNILEAIRRIDSVRAVIYVTSDKCYLNHEVGGAFKEDSSLGGKDPYSGSKAAAEMVCYAYQQSYFKKLNVGLASVRAGNVIGGGDCANNRLVPDCLKAFQKKQPVYIRQPNSIRPWQHVLDALFGYLFLATKLYENPSQYSESWNFGPDKESHLSVENVVRKIAEFYGSGEVALASDARLLYESKILELDCSKMKEVLGFYSRWDLNQTIKMTVEWHKKVWEGVAAEEVTIQQIESYMEEKE